jgi:uncharacterized alpha-E superfamily protein
MTLSGFALDGMTRDHGWRFLSIGRRIERLQFICSLLREALAGPADADLGWVLELADSSITYRSRYMARPEWLPVLDLLVRDVHNPRSVVFQLKGLNDFVGRICRLGAERGRKSPSAGRRGAGPGGHRSRRRPAARQRAPGRVAAGVARRLGAAWSCSVCAFSHVGEVNRQTFAT